MYIYKAPLCSHPVLLSMHYDYNWGERERAPTCGLNGHADPIDVHTVGRFGHLVAVRYAKT